MFDPKKLLDDLLGSTNPGHRVDGARHGRQGDAAGQGQSAGRRRAGRGAARHRHGPPGDRHGAEARRPRGDRRPRLQGLPELQERRASRPKPRPRIPNCCRRRPDTGFHPAQAPQGETEFALTLVRAMIAAAKADGHIDDEERKKIADRLALAGIGAEAEQFLMAELEKPLDSTRWSRRRRPTRRRSSSTPPRGSPSIPTRASSAAISTCWPAGCNCRTRWSTMSRRRCRRRSASVPSVPADACGQLALVGARGSPALLRPRRRVRSSR